MPALDLTSSPLVSVLLPAFNAASTILPAIRSILDGDYPNLECIVVDDGSDDDTFRAAMAARKVSSSDPSSTTMHSRLG